MDVEGPDPAPRRPGRAAGSGGHSGQPALQPRPRPGADRAPHVDHVQLRGAVDLDGALHPHLHAGLGADGAGDELEAGAVHDPARQHHRAGPDPAQLAPRHEVRHPVPGVRARAPTAPRDPTCRRSMRALVACGWFGIQAWIGGEALQHVLRRADPGLEDAARPRVRRPHRAPSGSRSCSSGGSTSGSSTAAWTCCGRSRTGPRPTCWW